MVIPKIGLSEEVRLFTGNQLKIINAYQIILYMKLLNYHWNVVGENFGPLHKLFKNGYELFFDSIDDVAERCAQLGCPAIGTLHEVIQLSLLKEEVGVIPKPQQMLINLNHDLEIIISFTREIVSHLEGVHYHESVTANFLVGILEKYEKYCWMVRAHIIL